MGSSFLFSKGGSMKKQHLYSYRGPVTSFGKIVVQFWYATTYAVSADKARNNLMYRFKQENGFLPGAKKIELPGKIILIG